MLNLSKGNRLRILYGLIVLVGIALDQLTKALIEQNFELYETLPIWEDVFHFTYVQNRGMAFSMLSNHRWVFLVFSSIAIVVLSAYLFRGISYMSDKLEDGSYPPLAPLGGIALSMIVSGGIGNMIDRLSPEKYVVDFIDVRLINFAIFNVADCFVCVGAALLALHLVLPFFAKKKEQ